MEHENITVVRHWEDIEGAIAETAAALEMRC